MILSGLLIIFGQVAYSAQLSALAAPKVGIIAMGGEEEAFSSLVGSVGKIQSNADEKTKLTEQQNINPGDRAVAAQIKAIDERNGAMVRNAVQSAQEFPNSGKIQRAAGAVAIQAGDYKTGLAYADRAVALAETKTDDTAALASALRTRATGALWSGDYPRAAEDAARVLNMFPADAGARAIYEMSRGRVKSGATADAASRPLAGALVADSFLDDPRLRAAGRRASDRVGALKQAAEAMRRIGAGDGATALAAANATVESDPTLADGYMMRGLALAILKDFSSALREFTKAIDLWSAQGDRANLPVALGRRAEARNEAKDYPGALRDAEQAVRADAGLGLGYFERARAREGLGEKEEGILADFRRAAELSPQYAADYASARARLSPGASAPASAPSRDRLLVAVAGACAFLVPILVMIWRRTRRARPEASIDFAAERKKLDAQYDIVAPLGAGGMGAVYKGWDKVLKRPVAIKQLRAELQVDARERGRFIREAEMVASLHHPHIVDIYNIIRDSSETYLVFEYVAGLTLHELLSASVGRRLAPARALEILRQIGEAVDHAHARRVIHRDLKPSNVMLADGGWVKVMDFGIARQVQDSLLTTTNTITGTPAYMSPEQAVGVVVKESDIFALGVTLYELLTGALPFSGPGELSDKMEARFAAPSALVPGLGRAIDEVALKALSPRPEDRYHDCADLYQAAVRALSGQAASAAPWVKTR